MAIMVAFIVTVAGDPIIVAAVPFLQTNVFDPLKPTVYMRRPVCALNVVTNSAAGQPPPVHTPKSAYPPAVWGTGPWTDPYSFPLTPINHSFADVLVVE
jgi:hypothetical protein